MKLLPSSKVPQAATSADGIPTFPQQLISLGLQFRGRFSSHPGKAFNMKPNIPPG